ncbi:hypothetical protein V2J09_021120 [Rumex salicifolius]
MWIAIICGLVVYLIFRLFFSDDDQFDIETSDHDAIFSVASRLEKLYGGKVYVGLHIPDADRVSRQNIDIVLVSKGEVVVVAVKNLAGFVTVNSDRSWTCMSERKFKEEHHDDPVAEVKRQAAVLEAYLERRGIVIPEGSLSYKVITPNPKCRSLNSENFPPEVITHDQWVHMKPESRNMLSGWIKGAFKGGKKESQESVKNQLNFAIRTAPMWDKLELRGSKHILGEFFEFKGKSEDTQALQCIKRSKVGEMTIQKTSMLGFAPRRLEVVYTPRDYQTDGASTSEWREVNVRSSTEIVFQPQNSGKVRKFKLSSVTSMVLSA